MEYLSKDFIDYKKNGDTRRYFDTLAEHVRNVSKETDSEYLDKRNIIEKEFENSEIDTLESLKRFEQLDELEKQINQKRIAYAREEMLKSTRELVRTNRLFGEEKDEEKKKTLEYKIREIREKIDTYEYDKQTTEKILKEYTSIMDFKNLYRSRKKRDIRN